MFCNSAKTNILITTVLYAFLFGAYCQEPNSSNLSQLTGKMITRRQKWIETLPLPFSSIVYFSNNDGIWCLGVLITLNNVLTDIFCGRQLITIESFRTSKAPELSKAVLGNYYQDGNEKEYNISKVDPEDETLTGLAVAILDGKVESSKYISVMFIPSEKKRLIPDSTVTTVILNKDRELKKTDFIVVDDDQGMISVVRSRRRGGSNYDIRLGGPLIHGRKLMGIAHTLCWKNEEYLYKNIWDHMEFIIKFIGHFQDFNESIHDPIFLQEEQCFS